MPPPAPHAHIAPTPTGTNCAYMQDLVHIAGPQFALLQELCHIAGMDCAYMQELCQFGNGVGGILGQYGAILGHKQAFSCKSGLFLGILRHFRAFLTVFWAFWGDFVAICSWCRNCNLHIIYTSSKQAIFSYMLCALFIYCAHPITPMHPMQTLRNLQTLRQLQTLRDLQATQKLQTLSQLPSFTPKQFCNKSYAFFTIAASVVASICNHCVFCK